MLPMQIPGMLPSMSKYGLTALASRHLIPIGLSVWP